jgi:hypothetical protein
MSKLSWQLIVETNPDTGELVFSLPKDLLDKQGWKEGDQLSYSDNGDGSWTLRKN